MQLPFLLSPVSCLLSQIVSSLIFEENLVVYLTSSPAGVGDAFADFDGFDGVDRHDGTGDAAVEFVVPRRVRAKAYGQSFATTSKMPPSVSPSDLAWSMSLIISRLNVVVRTIERGIDGNRCYFFPSLVERDDLDVAELDDMTLDIDAERGEKLFCDRSAGNTCGRLSCRGSFENVAEVAGLVFLSAGEIGMAAVSLVAYFLLV